MQFTLHQESTLKWRVSGTSCGGSRLRERFAAASLHEAIIAAAVLLDPSTVSDLPKEEVSHDLAEAFAEAIKAGHGQAESKKNLLKYATYFTDWVEKAGVCRWGDLRRGHVEGYVNFLVEGGYKRKTILNYLEAVRFTSRYMAACYPEAYRDITAGFRLRNGLGEAGIYSDDDGTEALSIGEVLEFHEWLGNHAYGRTLRLGVLLGGLLGLRVREVVYLTWQNVDLAAGTLVVQDEEGHRVKNKYSVRKLPLPGIVLRALREVPRTPGRILKVENERCYHPKPKKSFEEALQFYYSWMMNYALRQWRPGTKLTARALRRTIQTTAILNPGWNTYVVDRFCGHAPKTVMERHYFGDQKKRMVEVFRQQVVPRIDEEVDRFFSARAAEKDTKRHKQEPAHSVANARILDVSELTG